MKKALVVGLDNYPGCPLNGCVNDAYAVANVLETHSDGGPNFDVRLEINVSTRASLKAMIRQLFEGDHEVSLFYFSGHGFVNELGGSIVTLDYAADDEGISMNDIVTFANKSNVREKIIILDCCHSGAVGNNAINSNVSNIGQGVTILTASRDKETAMEINGHGVFTNLFIGALQGGAADLRGHITPGSIYSFIDQALGAWEQRPVFKTNVSKFISLRRVEPPIEMNVLRDITSIFNSPQDEIQLDPSFEYTEPSSIEKNISVFKKLQKYESVGLVTPIDEEHMYWAAMNSKSCRLTALGAHYWNLVKKGRV